MPEAGACCAPDAAPPAVCSAACRGAAHRAPHRSSQPRGVCASSQDTRVEAVRQSARASSLVPDVSGHTATAKGPRVCATAAADGLGWPPGFERCRHDRDGPASSCGRIRGSGCWAPGPRPAPARAAMLTGSDPDSRSHGLPHSSVCSLCLLWQHRSPSGPVVLHLDLELQTSINFAFDWGRLDQVDTGTARRNI